jgi:hypothetical protein
VKDQVFICYSYLDTIMEAYRIRNRIYRLVRIVIANILTVRFRHSVPERSATFASSRVRKVSLKQDITRQPTDGRRFDPSPDLNPAAIPRKTGVSNEHERSTQ